MNRVRFLKKIALAACFSLALAFTFSCSSDGGSGNSRATYWHSWYGVNEASYDHITDFASQYKNTTLSYDDVKNIWSEIKKTGTWIESYNGVSEQEIKDFLIQHDTSPKAADAMLASLKKIGNYIEAFDSSHPSYYALFVYFERE